MPRPLPLLTCLVAFALAPAGCDGRAGAGGEGDTGVSMDTVGSVVVVSNRDSGLWDPGDEWTLEEAFRLGSVSGASEELFSGPLMNVSLGPHGNLYGLDRQAGTVKVFDGQGNFLRQFAAEGPGPGELRAPAAIGWDALERLWVANGFNGRYTVFDTLGNAIKTEPRRMTVTARWQYPLTFEGDGSFIDEGGGSNRVHLLRVDTTGAVLDTFPTLKKPDRSGAILPPGFDREVLHYRPSLEWALAPDGTIWSAESGEVRLVQRTLDGDTLRIVETRHRTASLDPETERHAEREFAKLGLDRSEYTLVRPLVQSIHVMDDGHVLVQIIDEVERDGHLVDVFDPEGRFLGTVDLGFRMNSRAMPALVGDTLLAVTLSELDVPYAVRATIRR